MLTCGGRSSTVHLQSYPAFREEIEWYECPRENFANKGNEGLPLWFHLLLFGIYTFFAYIYLLSIRNR